jgi:hypothetical protein
VGSGALGRSWPSATVAAGCGRVTEEAGRLAWTRAVRQVPPEGPRPRQLAQLGTPPASRWSPSRRWGRPASTRRADACSFLAARVFLEGGAWRAGSSAWRPGRRNDRSARPSSLYVLGWRAPRTQVGAGPGALGTTGSRSAPRWKKPSVGRAARIVAAGSRGAACGATAKPDDPPSSDKHRGRPPHPSPRAARRRGAVTASGWRSPLLDTPVPHHTGDWSSSRARPTGASARRYQRASRREARGPPRRFLTPARRPGAALSSFRGWTAAALAPTRNSSGSRAPADLCRANAGLSRQAHSPTAGGPGAVHQRRSGSGLSPSRWPSVWFQGRPLSGGAPQLAYTACAPATVRTVRGRRRAGQRPATAVP